MIKNICVLVFIMAAGYSAVSQISITSNFNVNNDSWQMDNGVSTPPSPITWIATGGNPSGNVSLTASSGSVSFYALAPAQFTGDFSEAYNQTLTFDLQQSLAGTDNTAGDVILTNSVANISIMYQLPTKPATGAWSSYSVTLNESNFKNGCPTCPVITQGQMKLVLSNLTSLHIRLKYSNTTSSYTGSLDNVVLTSASIGAAPMINTIAPISGLPGTTVTIKGTNFNTANQNAVFFNGVEATILTTSATQLTVKSPARASYGPITVTNLATGQQASATQKFSPLFDNNNDFGGRIIPSSMGIGNAVTLPLVGTATNGYGNLDAADIDLDGWVDFLVTETSSGNIYSFRNLGSGGSVSAASFGARATLPALLPVVGASFAISELIIRDIDNDGKLDVAVLVQQGSGQSGFAIFRNVTTTATLTFAAPLFFPFGIANTGVIAAGDFDGDGRVDLVAASGTSPSSMWIGRNQSTPGNIDFAYGAAQGVTSGYADLDVLDLNNDNKPEIVASGYNASTFTVYENNSSPGVLSFTNFDVATSSRGSMFAVGDLDADGKPDFAWSDYGDTNLFIIKNNFNGTLFNASSFGSPVAIPSQLDHATAVRIADMNADGKPDVVAIGYSDMAIFQNTGVAGTINTSSFSKSVVFEGSLGADPIYGSGLSIADLDGDNKPEVSMVYTNGAVSAANRAVFIFHNESFPRPVITSLSSYNSAYGTSFIASGNNLNTGGAIPSIRTQGVLTNGSGITNTSFQTSALPGVAPYRMGVTIHGLSAYSPLQFNASYSSSHTVDATSFPSSIDIPLSTTTLTDGLTIADFDDDGKPDIVAADVVSGFSVAKIFQNKNTAGADILATNFTSISNTIGAVLHARADDIDGDGKIDLVVSGTLARNVGTVPSPLAFAPINSSISGVNRIITQHDLNNDGKTDIIVSTGSNTIAVFENQSRKGPFTASGKFYTIPVSGVYIPATGAVNGLTAADYDGDGWDDIAFGLPSSSVISVIRNNGSSSTITLSQFSTAVTFPASTSPNFITTADFDGDGKPDLAVGNSTSAFVSVYLNKSVVGTMNFTRQDIPVLTGTVGIETSDIDGDGKTDIVLIHQPTFSTGAFAILKNNSTSGNISFAAHVDYTLLSVPVSLAIADLNQDKKPDIIIHRNYAGTGTAAVSIFQNRIATGGISIDQQPITTFDVCTGATPTLATSASGTTNIKYQWQIFSATTSTFIDVFAGSGYSDPKQSSLTINTAGLFGAGQYRCMITGDLVSPVYTNVSTIGVEPLPAMPVTSDVSHCGPGAITLTATGATAGETYLWYNENGLIAGQSTGTYTTPMLTASATFQVALVNAKCPSARVNINVTIKNTDCNDLPPAITDPALKTTVGSLVKIDLLSIVSDPDNNLDQSSFSIVAQPSSGAIASIAAGSHELDISYQGSTFSGADKLTIKACDLDNECTSKEITILVSNDQSGASGIVVYNAVSPDGDGKNDFFFIQNIDAGTTSQNTVTIYNRWGDKVFSVNDYNNTSNKFTGYGSDGKLLPSGTYFYKISFGGTPSDLSGFLDIRY